MRNRALSLIAATAVVLAATIAPAAVAGAVTPTITLSVQLTDPSGAPLTSIDDSAYVRLISASGEGTYDEYRAAAPTPDSPTGPPAYVGTIVAGVATFADVPAGKRYTIQTHATADYANLETAKFAAKTVNYTKDLVLRKLATISGTLTDTDGFPIEGAIVRAVGNGEHTAMTEADGSYTLRGLRSHAYRIEFNTHWAEGGDYLNLSNTANSTYTWSYWPSATSAGKAKWVTVLDQSATKKNPTAKTGINGTVAIAHTVTMDINIPGAVGSDYGFQLTFFHKASGAQARNVVANTGGVTVPLNPGSYLVSLTILNSEHEKLSTTWFHGDGRPGVTHSHASTLTFTGTEDLTYSFGPGPA